MPTAEPPMFTPPSPARVRQRLRVRVRDFRVRVRVGIRIGVGVDECMAVWMCECMYGYMGVWIYPPECIKPASVERSLNGGGGVE